MSEIPLDEEPIPEFPAWNRKALRQFVRWLWRQHRQGFELSEIREAAEPLELEGYRWAALRLRAAGKLDIQRVNARRVRIVPLQDDEE